VTKRSQDRLRVEALSDNNLGQVVHTHVPLFNKQYNLVPVKGQRRFATGKVTIGLASHWPCVTDLSGLSTYGLNGLRKRDEHPAYAPVGV